MINTRSNFGLVKWLEDLTTDIVDTEFYPSRMEPLLKREAPTSHKKMIKYLLEVEVPGHNKKSLEIKVLDGVLESVVQKGRQKRTMSNRP